MSVYEMTFPLGKVRIVTGLDPEECERQQRVICERYSLRTSHDDLIQKLVHLYAQGVPIRTLARRFGKSPTTVYVWLRNAGVPHRPRL